jgi:phosphoribosyl 1,2-cyclic phosphodiesterase
MGMSVKLWGVRGSLPAPIVPEDIQERLIRLITQYDNIRARKNLTPQDFVKNLSIPETSGFGGHTSCVEVKTLKNRIIIDGGSGLRGLGEEVMRESSSLGRAKIHILMTHFHWDHLIGLPFFVPVFIPGNEIHFYAVHDDLEENIRRVFSKPNFPVEYEKLPAKLFFHRLEPRKPRIFDDFIVTPYQLDHPDPCWGFRIENGGKAFSHCVDSECTRVSREQLGADLPLYQNVDLLTFDAQYTFLEAAERIDWGHASGPVGIDLAMREKVKQVLFVHHDPAASDTKITQAELQTREYYEAALKVMTSQGQKPHEFDWCFAYEGMTIHL